MVRFVGLVHGSAGSTTTTTTTRPHPHPLLLLPAFSRMFFGYLLTYAPPRRKNTVRAPTRLPFNTSFILVPLCGSRFGYGSFFAFPTIHYCVFFTVLRYAFTTCTGCCGSLLLFCGSRWLWDSVPFTRSFAFTVPLPSCARWDTAVHALPHHTCWVPSFPTFSRFPRHLPISTTTISFTCPFLILPFCAMHSACHLVIPFAFGLAHGLHGWFICVISFTVLYFHLSPWFRFIYTTTTTFICILH